MPPLLMKVPLLAVEFSLKSVKPALYAPLTVVPLLMKVPLPAVEFPLKSVKPAAPPPGGAAVVREGGEASGGRVVSENYVSEEFGSMRNEILDDPRIVHDTRTAK